MFEAVVFILFIFSPNDCLLMSMSVYINNCVNLNRFTSEFDCIELLAKGGFGRVYKAREILVEKDFAVKIVRRKE